MIFLVEGFNNFFAGLNKNMNNFGKNLIIGWKSALEVFGAAGGYP
jgi:hypothetical protein